MLRQAAADDLEIVRRLTMSAYGPYVAEFGGEPLPMREDYAPRIANGEVWLLDIDGEPGGLAVLERHADHTMLFSIAVSPDHHSRGIGRTILGWVEDKTREWELPEVRLYTNARMERNIAIYRAFGFQETGRRPNPYRPGWVIVDMAKQIA
ncbi:N-acetyltransferase family protein [Rhizobium sp. 21-4511-3d]